MLLLRDQSNRGHSESNVPMLLTQQELKQYYRHEQSNNMVISMFYLHRTLLRGSVILLPLLGVTWAIGVFALDRNSTVFAWIFTLLNSLQVRNATTSLSLFINQ